MIINDFNILRSRSGPAEADAPLIVDTNAVLTLSIAIQSLKSVAGRRAQELERCRSLELRELAGRYFHDRAEARRFAGFKELSGIDALKALDHRKIV